ncbi:MAG: MFS transporter, partial [Terrimesophilobacter sp.]
LPMILGLMIASIGSGLLIARTGRYRMFPILGTGLMAAGFLYLSFLQYNSPFLFVAGGMLLIGLGLGQLMQTLTIASQNSVGIRDMGVATSASTFFRQIGGTLGTAIMLSLLFTVMPLNIQSSLTDAPTLRSALNAAMTPAVATAPENKAIMGLIYTNIVTPLESGSQQAAHAAGVQALVAQGVPQADAEAKVPANPLDFSQSSVRNLVLDKAVPEISKKLGEAKGDSSVGGSSAINDTSFLKGADPRLTKPFLTGFTQSTILIYWLAFGVVLLAFVLALFFKTPELRAKSALQEAADDAHAQREKDAAEAADDVEDELTLVH